MTADRVLKFTAVGKILQNCDFNTAQKLHKDFTEIKELGNINYLLRRYTDTHPGIGT